jgi:protein-S-isoprenylcysteine O-methyltransferase Ste14
MVPCTTLPMAQRCWNTLSACTSSPQANHGHMFPKLVCFSCRYLPAHLCTVQIQGWLWSLLAKSCGPWPWYMLQRIFRTLSRSESGTLIAWWPMAFTRKTPLICGSTKSEVSPPLRWFRHPSYAGFYYWALGTQLILQNPLTFVLFTILLWRFFYYRTRGWSSFFIEDLVSWCRR